jgi:hypothetical protein
VSKDNNIDGLCLIRTELMFTGLYNAKPNEAKKYNIKEGLK